MSSTYSSCCGDDDGGRWAFFVASGRVLLRDLVGFENALDMCED